ncbi:hypothetical protein [Novosphingopyxis sp. YJ-S2-01]|uniref:hypothetical protein n=1 Tax=Novosphingopyxis sp. YJ-S2-01 TaxID=2794021 RepID=UPI0018DC20EB|nr:hypothetical protein [Novosphingopyxis sp. YJ-S2-01]MBH9536694.1 hypothetical protein [Novosphingopyxis sp. YJ-S2-01]
MNFLSQANPKKAYADLRFFLSQERPFKLLFFTMALVPAIGLVVALIIDAHEKSAPPPPEIIYVESWPIDRSMAVIMKEREERRIREEAHAEQVRENYKSLGRMVGMDVEKIEAEASSEQGGAADAPTKTPQQPER